MTEEASEKLTEAFSYHIPQRWSIAHLYQAILKGEEHVKDIRLSDNTGRIYPLETDRREGARYW